MRVFAGLSCSLDTTAWILAHRPLLLPADARWVPVENWHLTLAFFGERSEEEIQKLDEMLFSILQGHPAIQLRVKKLRWKGHTLWVELESTPSWRALVQQVHKAAGLPISSDPIPHITIARSRHKLQGEVAVPSPAGILVFTTAYLYESILRREGAQYIPLRRYLLDITVPR